MTTDPTAPRRPGPRAPDGGLAPVGSRRVEETLTRMMSLFGLLFALQTLPLLVQGWPAEDSPLGLAVVVCVFGVIAVAGLGVLLHQWVRGLFLLTGAVYLGALSAGRSRSRRPGRRTRRRGSSPCRACPAG